MTVFSVLLFAAEHLVTNGTGVAFAYALAGTRQGPLMVHSVGGNPISIRGMQIGRFTDGKLGMRWGSSDQQVMLELRGLAP